MAQIEKILMMLFSWLEEEMDDPIGRFGLPVLELRTVASVFNADTLKYLDCVCSGKSIASWPGPWWKLKVGLSDFVLAQSINELRMEMEDWDYLNRYIPVFDIPGPFDFRFQLYCELGVKYCDGNADSEE